MKTTVTIKTWAIIDEFGRPLKSFLSEEEARHYQFDKYSTALHNFAVMQVDLETQINLSLDNLNINIKKE